ncbi:MAG: hypothetical protein K8R68_09200 [Bacteroidales bacterium]|nr:hypothetical protein [Bacteroidales bacterium]
MKNQIKNIVLLLLLIAMTVELKAQKESNFSVQSITASIGGYNPSLDYWNDNYLPESGFDNKFEGNFSLGGQIEFALPVQFTCRVGASFWSDKVKNENHYLFNAFKISFTRFSLAGIYKIEKAKLPITPYLGLQGSFYIITNKFTHNNSTSMQQGQDYSWAPLFGLEKTFSKHFITGIEFLYHIGSYTQDVNIGIETKKQKVLINGPELFFKLGYKF